MATRKLILGGAASLLLSGAMIAVAPVRAQTSDPAQTYADAQARYQSELQDYNLKQQNYERQRSEYNARMDSYRYGPLPSRLPDAVGTDVPATVAVDPDPDVVVVDRDPGQTVVVRDPDRPDIVVADDFRDRLLIRDVPPLMRVEDVADANYALFNIPVLDSAGLTVGHFRRIETKQPGDLVAVITLNGSRRTISVLTEHVRFDPGQRMIIADLTGREMDLIPSGFPYG